eukprot:GHUV01056123.1.p1 GENE.GHUV01056123.1~~GHUV01056123.1.p1  ORF type:complete len:110 (-),score=13.46 GHUV01056123.1:15-344(-)
MNTIPWPRAEGVQPVTFQRFLYTHALSLGHLMALAAAACTCCYFFSTNTTNILFLASCFTSLNPSCSRAAKNGRKSSAPPATANRLRTSAIHSQPPFLRTRAASSRNSQ